MTKNITLSLTLAIPDNPVLTGRGYEELVAKALASVAKEGRIDHLHVEATECLPARILVVVDRGLASVGAVAGQANVIIADLDNREVPEEEIESEFAERHLEGTQENFRKVLQETQERMRPRLSGRTPAS